MNSSTTLSTVASKIASVVNRGAWNGSISGSGGSVTIPVGYHNGSGKVTGPTLATLVGSNVSATANGHVLSGVTAYGKNGVKLTGSHTCPTLATLVGGNVNLDNNARLLSGYTAYGKNGTKYTGSHTCPTLATLITGGSYIGGFFPARTVDVKALQEVFNKSLTAGVYAISAGHHWTYERSGPTVALIIAGGTSVFSWVENSGDLHSLFEFHIRRFTSAGALRLTMNSTTGASHKCRLVVIKLA